MCRGPAARSLTRTRKRSRGRRARRRRSHSRRRRRPRGSRRSTDQCERGRCSLAVAPLLGGAVAPARARALVPMCECVFLEVNSCRASSGARTRYGFRVSVPLFPTLCFKEQRCPRRGAPLSLPASAPVSPSPAGPSSSSGRQASPPPPPSSSASAPPARLLRTASAIPRTR